MSTGLSRVEVDLHGRAHCAWCDTPIAKGSPRVARAFYHAPGHYSRNNGAVTGYNPGGLQDEYMHAQCTFQYDSNPKGQPAKCVACGSQVVPPHRVLSRFGKPGARCTPATSSPLYYCFTCTKDFVQRHRELLVGWLGAEQSEAAVAWRSAGPFALSSADGGPPPLPRDTMRRADFLACFEYDPPQSEEDAAAACSRHRALQEIIGKALKEDRTLLHTCGGGAASSASASVPAVGSASKKRIASQEGFQKARTVARLSQQS
jgi:DNA-directed RNA polymerase subunit RPC12/RpoP